MSSYRGRTGPNFYQYLNDLNTVSPPDYPFAAEEPDFSEDLAMFTNTDFTQIDMPPLPEDGGFDFEMPQEAQARAQSNAGFEGVMRGPNTSQPFSSAAAVTTQSPVQSGPIFPGYNTPLQPAPPHEHFPADGNRSGTPSASVRRSKTEPTVSHEGTPDEHSRLAAEEDKRRRNTAASARFRVKKKQREQTLERTVKDTQEKNSKLEARITQLEMENKWLKELITEKNGISSKEEMAAAYQKYQRESEERDVKQAPPHVSGVGTH